MDSTVRKIQPNITPEITPEIVTQAQPLELPQIEVKQKVRFSAFEKVMASVIAAIAVIMMVALVHTTVSVSASQRQLQDVQTSITKVKTANTDLQQEIGELSSSDRLAAYAKKNGLTFKEANVRNVTK
ncbi:cell division protein FtsL [Lapidilactobacillus bayanensis]|uniref:cell division protein FtsL n=1 Tax=Lapidilactobacillus bayanensis TaxID=2485998 RepID=UPI000F76D975|nr:cell division protein FtsL [Lapidilactobacillus bayanensis]